MKVLLIDEDRGRAALLKAALNHADCEIEFITNLNRDWCRQVQDSIADVILINMDSPDRDTLEYLTGLKQQQPKPVVMFANDDTRETIHAAVKAGVSAYVVDGLNPNRVKAVLEVAVARFNEYQAMREELQATKTQLAERKLIEKAKGLLMKHKGISEDQAYQTLRKLAMDKNKKIAEIAEQLLAMADVLI